MRKVDDNTFLNFRVVWPYPAPRDISPFVFAKRPDFSRHMPPGGGATGSSSLVKHVRFRGVLEEGASPNVATYKTFPASNFVNSQHVKDLPKGGEMLSIHVYRFFIRFWPHRRLDTEIQTWRTVSNHHAEQDILGACIVSSFNVFFFQCPRTCVFFFSVPAHILTIINTATRVLGYGNLALYLENRRRARCFSGRRCRHLQRYHNAPPQLCETRD